MKWTSWAALAVCVLIPVVFLGGMAFAAFINPEWAVHTAHYVLIFSALQGLKRLLMFASLGTTVVLWVVVFLLILKGKGRSSWWAALAALGPFGLAFLAMLDDADPQDAYSRWRAGQGLLFRAAAEAVFFFAAWSAAYELVVLWRNARILAESAFTGASVAQIVAVQNASSGMWAFGEGLEEIFLVALVYLAWPFVFNLAARWRSGPERA
jgi:hypothetical protein